MKKKTKKKKISLRGEILSTLTVCSDCRIRLVVRKSESKQCGLCQSPNIVAEPWR